MKSDVLLIGVFMSFCPVRTETGVVGGDMLFSTRAALSLTLSFLPGIFAIPLRQGTNHNDC